VVEGGGGGCSREGDGGAREGDGDDGVKGEGEGRLKTAGAGWGRVGFLKARHEAGRGRGLETGGRRP